MNNPRQNQHSKAVDAQGEHLIRAHLRTRHLVLLVELGRHGSIIGAAGAANITQPAASKLLAELERVMGVQLFERLPRGVEPTAYGAVLIRRAAAALAEMHGAHREVVELMSGISGRVKVGSVLTPSTGLVADAVNLLRLRHHRVRVSISVDTSKILVGRLLAGELDIVVGRILERSSAGELDFEPVTDEPHSLIGRAGHPLLSHGELTLAELARQPWIVPPAGSLLRDRLAALFRERHLEFPTETVETAALPVIANLLVKSSMVVAMPGELVKPYIDTGQLAVIAFDLGIRMEAYGIITRRGDPLAPGAQLMAAALREVAARRYARR